MKVTVRFVLIACTAALLLIVIIVLVNFGGTTDDASSKISNDHQSELDNDALIRKLLFTPNDDNKQAGHEVDAVPVVDSASGLLSGLIRGGLNRETSTTTEMTLSIAIVLVVSLLSVTLLLVIICCVIVATMIFDSSTISRDSSVDDLSSDQEYHFDNWNYEEQISQKNAYEEHELRYPV